MTALNHAAENGHTNVVSLLVEANANVNLVEEVFFPILRTLSFLYFGI